MRQISFADFYQETKNKLTLDQMRSLNPFIDFFESNGCFVGLEFKEKGIWISIAVGTSFKWLWDFKKECLRMGVKAVGFVTSPTNKSVNAIAKYCGAELRFLNEQYPNGEEVLEYTVYFDNKRFRRAHGGQ